MQEPISVFDIVTLTGADLERILTEMASGHLAWKFRDGHIVTTHTAVREWNLQRRAR